MYKELNLNLVRAKYDDYAYCRAYKPKYGDIIELSVNDVYWNEVFPCGAELGMKLCGLPAIVIGFTYNFHKWWKFWEKKQIKFVKVQWIED